MNHIKAFGRIAEITGASFQTEPCPTVASLREHIEKVFPALKGLQYTVAIDRKMASPEAAVPTGAEIALLPPFSGG